jgi:hypothetical protein
VIRRALLTWVGVVPLVGLATMLTVHCGGTSPAPSARTSADDGPPSCAAMWREGFELDGVVGGRESQAYFDMWPAPGAPDEQVSGIVVFPRERMRTVLADTPIGLAGPLGANDCAVQLTQRDGDDGGVWTLRIESRAQVTGHRRLRDGRTEDIIFSIVPETPCDGAGEWRTFSSPAWPITFDYPAAWVITDDHDDIAIECPSVTRLAHGGWWLSFEQGQFAPRESGSASRTPDSFTEPFWFTRLADDDWRVNDACDRSDCPPARRSERNGITTLQGAAGEHRLYRPGVGYLGQGSGITRYLFIVGDRWVSLDMAGTNAHDDDIGNDGGPVLFNGDGVGDRLVRTIMRAPRAGSAAGKNYGTVTGSQLTLSGAASLRRRTSRNVTAPGGLR